jgi:hypothetical protein
VQSLNYPTPPLWATFAVLTFEVILVAYCRQATTLADSFGNFEAKLPRRVVVTGLGLVTPLGIGTERVWESLTNGGCGIRAITAEDFPKVSCLSTQPEATQRRCTLTDLITAILLLPE